MNPKSANLRNSWPPRSFLYNVTRNFDALFLSFSGDVILSEIAQYSFAEISGNKLTSTWKSVKKANILHGSSKVKFLTQNRAASLNPDFFN